MNRIFILYFIVGGNVQDVGTCVFPDRAEADAFMKTLIPGQGRLTSAFPNERLFHCSYTSNCDGGGYDHVTHLARWNTLPTTTDAQKLRLRRGQKAIVRGHFTYNGHRYWSKFSITPAGTAAEALKKVLAKKAAQAKAASESIAVGF